MTPVHPLLPFSIPLARTTDPHTSHRAAAQAKGVRHAHALAIFETLAYHARPMAAEEIARHVHGVNAVQIARRFAELERAGLIEPTDQLHTNLSGRLARRYRLTEFRRPQEGRAS